MTKSRLFLCCLRRAARRRMLFPAIALLTVLVSTSIAWSVEPVMDSVLGPAPGTYRITAPEGVVRLPFKLFRGDILLTGGKVNGHDVRMMVDNGMLWDQLLFFGSPIIDSLGLKYDGEIGVGGQGEGDQVNSRTASGITISFPGIEFFDQTAVVTPYTAGFANMWEGTEGQVSATLWKHFVVDINFDSMIITLIEPGKFKYAGSGIEVPMKPADKGYWAIPGTIELVDGRRVALDLSMDLGYNDYLRVDSREVHKLARPDRAIDASLGFGVQGETRGYIGRVRTIEIGRYRLNDVLTGFVASDDKGELTVEAMIGLGLFSHFNIVYDYPGHRVFLEPNRHYAEPSEYNMSGFDMRGRRTGAAIVTRVYSESPAAEAGLAVGDTVTAVNGTKVADYDYFELQDLFLKQGALVTLTIRTNGQEKPVILKLRRVI